MCLFEMISYFFNTLRTCYLFVFFPIFVLSNLKKIFLKLVCKRYKALGKRQHKLRKENICYHIDTYILLYAIYLYISLIFVRSSMLIVCMFQKKILNYKKALLIHVYFELLKPSLN